MNRTCKQQLIIAALHRTANSDDPKYTSLLAGRALKEAEDLFFGKSPIQTNKNPIKCFLLDVLHGLSKLIADF